MRVISAAANRQLGNRRRRQDVDTTFMGVRFTAPLLAYLHQLVEIGLHGDDIGEVCVELIRQGVIRAVDDGLLQIRRPAQRKRKR